MFDVFWSILGGGIGGTITSFGFRYWQAQKGFDNSRVTAQVNEVVEDVRRLESISREYWMLPGTDLKCPHLALEITTLLHRIGGLVGILEYDGWVFGAHDVSLCVKELHELATGGDFQVKQRKADQGHAGATAIAATDLILALRQARRNAD